MGSEMCIRDRQYYETRIVGTPFARGDVSIVYGSTSTELVQGCLVEYASTVTVSFDVYQ